VDPNLKQFSKILCLFFTALFIFIYTLRWALCAYRLGGQAVEVSKRIIFSSNLAILNILLKQPSKPRFFSFFTLIGI